MDYKVSVLVFSYPGIGKTTLLATAGDDERTFPCLFLDCEAHTLPIMRKIIPTNLDDVLNNAVILSDEQMGKVHSVRIRKWEEVEKIVDLLERGEYPWKSVCVDSLSEINWLNLRNICTTQGKNRVTDNDPPQLEHYARSNVQVLRLVRRFRDILPHVFFSCHVREDKDECTGVIQLKANLVGQLSGQVGYLINCLGYYFADRDSKRILSFCPTHKVVAKDGTAGGRLIEPIEDPTISKILERIEGR